MIKLLLSKKNRNFLRLWLAQLISQFGDRIHQLALVGLMAERMPGSAMSLAKLMSFTILPVFILQPIAGVYVDRWNRRNTLFFCDLIRGLLVLLIPMVFIYQESMIPIYAVVFLVFCIPRFYIPAKMSIIPDLVHKESLLKANSLITTTGMIAAGLGAVLGAFIIEHFGARRGFLIDALTFFASAVLIMRMGLRKRRPSIIKQSTKRIVEAFHHTIFREIKEGWDYIATHKEIRLVINMLFVLFAAAGAIYVVMIVFIQQTFNSVTKDLGIIAVSLVCGLFLGVLGFGKWGKATHWVNVVFLCLKGGGIVLILFAFFIGVFPSLILAIVLSFLWGLVIAPIFVVTNTVVHQVSDEHMRGKVFSALEIVIHGAFLITMLLSSWLTAFVSEWMILIWVGVFCVLFGAINYARYSREGGLAL